jgi:hypothetical protein
MQVTCVNAFDLGVGGAVTDQYNNTYPLPDGGYAVSLTNTYVISGQQPCDKSQVLLDSSAYNALISGAPPPVEPASFYADSTEMFYLGLVAVVVVWAVKTFVQKLFWAS